MDTSKIVGEKIKALREDKSISIEELAQRSGLAIEQIERIENNIDIPSLAPLIKIAFPIMRFIHASTWNIIHCLNRKRIVTWSRLSLT